MKEFVSEIIAIKNKIDAIEVALKIAKQPQLIAKLIKLKEQEKRYYNRLGWVISTLIEENSSVLLPLQNELAKLSLINDDEGWLRGGLKALSLQSIKKEHLSALFDRCLFLIKKRKCGVAVKVWSCDIVLGILNQNPELSKEFIEVLQQQYSQGTIGWKRKIEKTLQKITNFAQ